MRLFLSFLLSLVFISSATAADKNLLKGIKGKDDRILIENYKYPWSAIGRPNNEYGGHCSAVLIAPKIALTAAHCFYNKKRKKWYKPHNFFFLAGYHRGSYIETTKGVKFHIAPQYDPNNQKRVRQKIHDWALLELRDDLSDRTGVIGMSFTDRKFFNELISKKTVFTQAGYSQDKKHILSINRPCALKRYNAMQNIITHTCDAVPGDSGSPIFFEENGHPLIAAIHVATAYNKKNSDAQSTGIAVPTSLIAKQLKKMGLWKQVQNSKKPTS